MDIEDFSLFLKILKLKGCKFKTDERKFFFIQQVIKIWNLLPEDGAVARGNGNFKRDLHRFMVVSD